MNEAKELQFGDFASADDPISRYNNGSFQFAYLIQYLSGLGAKKFLSEPNYFDRDYLDEFSTFYSLSAFGYSNVCSRTHYFDADTCDEALFAKAAGGDETAVQELSSSYLGFIVLRPITETPIGRTVFRWFEDKSANTVRVTNPSREYKSHVLGLELVVVGLAWQQQDAGVASCATIGLWTTMHSSAFDARHSIPTTVSLTEAAHKGHPTGDIVYPSEHLAFIQVLEAIKAQGLNPIQILGDAGGAFTLGKFANSVTGFVRSGYPVIVWGIHLEFDVAQNSYVKSGSVGHVVCAVGIRESVPSNIPINTVRIQDEQVSYFYIHDDNIGPNVRFKGTTENIIIPNADPRLVNNVQACVIAVDTPHYQPNINVVKQGEGFLPLKLIVAVHEEIRISVANLQVEGESICQGFCKMMNLWLKSQGLNEIGLAYSSRLIMLSDYLSTELSRLLMGQSKILSQVKFDLAQKVPPMSLHVAIIRVALDDTTVLFDVLVDTTSSNHNLKVFAHIVFDQSVQQLLATTPDFQNSLGQLIEAY